MSSGQTVVRYNGVQIFHCHTREFRQEAISDEASGNDLLYFKFTIRVVGYLHGRTDYTGINVLPNLGGNNAAGHHKTVRRQLTEPRGDFEMTMGADSDGEGGAVILEAKQSTRGAPVDKADLNSGPKGKVLAITHVVANELLRIEAEFEVCVLECESSLPASNVLSNKWSVTDDLDRNFMTTRVYSGRLRVTSAVFSPNSFRDWVLPPLQPGMRREKMTFVVTEDSLNLMYTITDREVAFAPPAPATSWHMSHTTETGDGKVVFSTIAITLAGDRYANKRKLLQIAAAAIDAKLITGVEANEELVEFVQFTDETGDDLNRIHAVARVKHTVGQSVLKGSPLEHLGIPLDQEPVFQNFDGTYDSRFSRGLRAGEQEEVEGPIDLISAFTCYLQSSCDGVNHAISGASLEDGAGTPSPGEKVEVTIYQVGELPGEPVTYISQAHRTAVYTFYQMESTYDINEHKLQLPIANDVSLSSGGSEDTSAIVTIAPPTARRMYRIKAERVGDWPTLPEPVASISYGGGGSGSVTATLLSKKIRPGVPERSPDGKLVYRADIEVVYALSRAPNNSEQLLVGTNPWEDFGADNLHVTSTGFLGGPPA